MYNRKANSILAEFKYISGDLRVQAMQCFCSSYYGSQLWNLSNKCLENYIHLEQNQLERPKHPA